MSKEPERNIKIEVEIDPNKEVYDTLVIDRSGSMSYVKGPTIEGVNSYITKYW